MGPTASGKTNLAMGLCDHFAIDIISVDAAQVYRGMSIGTAKPDSATLKRYPHKLIDLCDPAQRYSAGRFRVDALREIRASLRRGRIPCLTGGTMFYFKALSDGLSQLPRASKDVGEQIRSAAARSGWPQLHARLREIDAAAAESIDPQDSQRIQRLLEVYYLNGELPSVAMRESPPDPMPFDCVRLAVTAGARTRLRTLIGARFQHMLESGFLDEVHSLYSRPDLDASMPSMKSAGYAQAWEYFDGSLDFDAMTAKAVQATCAVAKRQLTWLRNAANAVWLDNSSPNARDLLIRYLERRFPTRTATEIR